MPRRLTTEEFISRAREKHGDKYSYDKAKYYNNITKVIITCPVHGGFEQIPHDHTNGAGCPHCSGNARLTTEQFVEKARKTHGDRFNYDKAKYKNNCTKVIITCPKHGDFEQEPANHYKGQGCPRCSPFARSTTEEFIEKARAAHGDKYNYDKVKYENNTTKVTITCPFHGDFEQEPRLHSRGHGCAECHSWTEKTRLYLVELESYGERFLKLGVTNYTVQKRYNNTYHANQTVIREIAYKDFEHSQEARVIEKRLLDKYKDNKYIPKISFSGHTECLGLGILEEIKKTWKHLLEEE